MIIGTKEEDMHKTHSRKRMFLFLCVLAMLALGCRVITDLFKA